MTFKVCRTRWKAERSVAHRQLHAAVTHKILHLGEACLFSFLLGKGAALPGAGNQVVFHFIHEGSPSVRTYCSRKPSCRLITGSYPECPPGCFICNLQSALESPLSPVKPHMKSAPPVLGFCYSFLYSKSVQESSHSSLGICC